MTSEHHNGDKNVLQSFLRCFALHTFPITDDTPSQQQRMTLVWRDNKGEVHCQRYTFIMPWHPSCCTAQAVALPITYTSSHRTAAEYIQSVPCAAPSPLATEEAYTTIVYECDCDVTEPNVEKHYTPTPPSPLSTSIAQHSVHTNAPSAAPAVYLGAPLDATTIRHLLRRCHALTSKDHAHTTRNVAPTVAAADLQALAALFPLLHNGALYCTAEAFIDHCAHDDEHLFLCETLPWYPIHECPSQLTSNTRRRENEDGVADSKADEDKELSDAALPFFTTLYMTLMDAWEERVPQAKCTTTDRNSNADEDEDDYTYDNMCDGSISEKEKVITYEAHVGLWCGYALSALLARQLTPTTAPSSTTDEAFLISAANDDLLQLGPTTLRVHGEMLRWWSALQTHEGEEEESELNALHAAATLWCAADNASTNDMSNASMTPAQLNEARVRFFFSEVALLLATALVRQTRREEKSAAIAKAMAECAKEEDKAAKNTILITDPRSPSHASASLQSCSEGTTSYKRPRTDTTSNSNNVESEPSVLQRRNELLLFLLLHEPQTPQSESVESATAT